MKIAIIGTGYVGLPTGVGLAELGYHVTCIDREQCKIDALRSGKITLYEDGLEELFNKNLKAGRIVFTTSMKNGVKGADIVFIAVGTPPHPVTKEADMQHVYAAATEMAAYLDGYTVVVNKSTVPVGTGDIVEGLIHKKNPAAKFDVVSLPEFLREGFAVHDFFHPDRIVIGTNSEKAKEIISKMYEPLVKQSPTTEIFFVGRRSSETIKYASNAFLAIKIHYINEMANFCEAAGADITEVAKGMGLDSRIGNKFLCPGPGYGGSCFPKDTMAMAFMARQNDVDLTLIETTIKGNNQRKVDMAERIFKNANTEKPKIAVLGLAFKGGTDDCRESPAVEIISVLLRKKSKITAYDPKAMDIAKQVLGNAITYANDVYSAVEGADAIAVLTEWDDFKNIDLEKLAQLTANKVIVDCRNIINKAAAEKAGFTYVGIGI